MYLEVSFANHSQLQQEKSHRDGLQKLGYYCLGHINIDIHLGALWVEM